MNTFFDPSADTALFYDELADSYHLIFEDWDRSIARQAEILSPLLSTHTGKLLPSVLDCACGIGTQALGLAQRGHQVTGSDLSPAAIDRAKREATGRQLDIAFHVADLRSLAFPETCFDVVLAADNALPHLLTQTDLQQALRSMASKLSPDGILVATLRDYDHLLVERPITQPPAFFQDSSGRRIVHQLWNWDADQYDLHLYLTIQSRNHFSGWQVRHFHSRYRALQRAELNTALQNADLEDIQWLEPATTTFYQPIVIAKRPTTA